MPNSCGKRIERRRERKKRGGRTEYFRNKNHVHLDISNVGSLSLSTFLILACEMYISGIVSFYVIFSICARRLGSNVKKMKERYRSACIKINFNISSISLFMSVLNRAESW